MREFDLTEPERWPAAVKALCCVASAVCVLALGNALVLADLRADAAGARREHESLRTEHERGVAAAGRLNTERAEQEQAATTFATLLQRLPANIETPGVIGDISRAAVARNLLLTDIALAEQRETPLTVEQPISIAVVGGYHELGAFAGDLAGLAVPVALHGFRIQPAEDDAHPGKLAMTVVAKVHRYAGEQAPAARRRALPDSAPLPPLRGAPVAAYRAAHRPDPFRSHSAAAAPNHAGGTTTGPGGDRARQPLEQHPLAQLLLVGTLAANGARHALVRAPDGGIHRLTQGDYLGRDHGRIHAVHDTFVELVEMVRDGAGGWQRRPRTIVMDSAATAGGVNNQRREQ